MNRKGIALGVLVYICVASFIVLLLSGCTPYAFVGTGYGFTDNPGFDDGMVGNYGAGIDFDNAPLSCEYIHRSLIGTWPEAITNDFTCRATWRMQ